MKKRILTGMLLWVIAASIQCVYAQEATIRKEQKAYNYSVAVQPLYLLNGGLRIDFEKRLKDPRKVIQVSAIGYLLPKTDYSYDQWESLLIGNDYNINKLIGGGLALDYKWFPFQSANFIYFSGGISYNYYNVRYEDNIFINYQEDGMTFYEPRWAEIKQVFNKTGTNVCFGIQNPPNRPFLIETYIGLGYSYSFYDENKHHINEDMFNVGYRGMTFVIGGRIGWRFGR